MALTPEEEFFREFKSLTGRSIRMANLLMNFPMKREYNNAAAALLLELKVEVERMREARCELHSLLQEAATEIERLRALLDSNQRPEA